MKKHYRYILVTNLYLNESLHIIDLAKKLMLDAKPLTLNSKITFPILNKLPAKITEFIRVMRICFKFFIQKKFVKNKEVIELERFGHLFLKRQLNNISIDKSVYKLFDFNKQQIISQYDSSVQKQEIDQDIQKLKIVKSLNVAPNLLEINYEGKFYVEEYLNLSHPHQNQWNQCLSLIRIFINELYTSFTLKQVTKKKFINNLNFEIREEYLKNPIFKEEATKILMYITEKKDYIKSAEYETLEYAQSHGDINKTNFFLDNDKIIGIDWELLGYRPLYYDVFYFMLIVNRKDFNLAGEEKLDVETKSLIKYLNEKNKLEGIANKEFIEFYLNCFILEYLNWKLRVYLSFKNNSDFRRRLSEVNKDICYIKNNSTRLIEAFK